MKGAACSKGDLGFEVKRYCSERTEAVQMKAVCGVVLVS